MTDGQRLGISGRLAAAFQRNPLTPILAIMGLLLGLLAVAITLTILGADLLVAVADFFTRVHGLRWIAVSGLVDKTVIVIFRGDGGRDIGRLADACFHDVGVAGGHRHLARAEFPLSAVPEGLRPGEFVLRRLETRKLRPRAKNEDPPAHPAERGAA